MKITEEKKEKNIKLYPVYKMISWDLLFYYTIIFLFLTQVKHISPADVLLAEALYPAFKAALLFPLTALVRKIGKRKCLILGNFVNIFSVMAYIVTQNLAYVMIGQFLSAIAFTLKSITESNFIYDSLPKNEKRGSLFTKLDGKGNAWYYYLDAISSLVSGFLYVINGYIPLILCLISCIISTILCVFFEEVGEERDNTISTKQYIKDLRQSFRYMMQSKRMRYLIFFGATLSGFLGMLVTLRSATLEQINFPEQYYGVVFATLGILAGFASRAQNQIHNLFRNRTLKVLALPTTISCMLIGLIVIGNYSYRVTVALILWMFLIQFLSKGAFYSLIKRYLNNFTTMDLREKIISLYTLAEGIFRAIIGLFVSWLLRGTVASNVVFIIGGIFTIVFVLLLDKIRTKVGLKPEEYEPKEIQFTVLK